jgi:hypothetical protein
MDFCVLYKGLRLYLLLNGEDTCIAPLGSLVLAKQDGVAAVLSQQSSGLAQHQAKERPLPAQSASSMGATSPQISSSRSTRTNSSPGRRRRHHRLLFLNLN